MKLETVLVLLLFLILAVHLESIASNDIFSGKVVRVLSGDTIEVEHSGTRTMVRLAGVDRAQRGHGNFIRTRLVVAHRVLGKEVAVEMIPYSRRLSETPLGVVWYWDGDREANLNEDLFSAGLAHPYGGVGSPEYPRHEQSTVPSWKDKEEVLRELLQQERARLLREQPALQEAAATETDLEPLPKPGSKLKIVQPSTSLPPRGPTTRSRTSRLKGNSKSPRTATCGSCW